MEKSGLSAIPFGASEEQSKSVHHVLGSKDFIISFKGPAGAGKTTRIHRQRIPELRAAIEDLSKGRMTEGFDKLDKFGVIQEISDDAGRLAAIAKKQIEAFKAQRSSLIKGARGDLSRPATPESFTNRVDEIRQSLQKIADALSKHLDHFEQTESPWLLEQVELKFSLDLEAEAGVVIVKTKTTRAL